jgi:hypothetical protein
VELVPYNLLQYSEQFNNGVWGAVDTTITANTTTAPDGTLTADTMVISSSTSRVFQSTSLGAGTYTASVYVKSLSGTPTIQFRMVVDGVDITDSIPTTTEWVRHDYTFTASTSMDYFVLRGQSGTGSVAIWGAQLVEGSTAKDYQKTETRLNIPRLDYSNGTCPSLLVEPQRTNAVTYSEFFSTANGYNYQNASQSGSSIVSPSGLLAYGITSTTSANDFHRYYKTLGGRTGVNTTTIFAKKGTSRYLGLGINQNGSTGNNNVVVFDLQNGVIASNTYGVTASIEDFGNGWYRLVHTFNYGTGGTYADICVHNTGTSTYTINAFQTFDSPSSPTTIYVWGLQMEVGSYSTSYIPTTSASVTRNADVISKTGISSLIGQTEGVFYVEMTCDFKNPNGAIPFYVRGGITEAYNESTYIQMSGSGFTVAVYNNFALQAALTSGTYTDGQLVKIAFAYKANDFVLYVNGVQTDSDNSGTPSASMDGLDLGTYFAAASTFQYDGSIKAVALWPTRLTNTQLQSLTTI